MLFLVVVVVVEAIIAVAVAHERTSARLCALAYSFAQVRIAI